MTTRADLLADVCAQPDDDTKRAAFADYLDAYQPERAEFIRLQLSRFASEVQRKATRSQVGTRERELLAKHGEEWARYIEAYVRPSRHDPKDQGWRFERGFVAFARMEPENFIALGQRLFDMAPIQHADLYGGEDPVRPLFDSPYLSRLDSLSLSGAGLDDDDAIALAQCEALTRCSWLDLSLNKITERGVRALAASPVMAKKTVVLMEGNPCNPVDEPHLDWDTSIADYTPSPVAEAIEREIGRVEWFHHGWWKMSDVPDRFHARWVPRPKRS